MESKSQRIDGIQVYNGRQIGGFKVINSGKCVISNACSFSLISWISILAPTLCQFYYINPKFGFWNYFLTPLNFATMCVSLTFLLITTMSDPGVIPRNTGKNQLAKG